MKQFLRYQISGSIFFLWGLVFYYGENDWSLFGTFKSIINLNKDYIIIGLAIAMPIGVLIHQLSVLLKNWIIGEIWEEFSDGPKKDIIDKISPENEKIKYCIERISNLNSFYYVRFDNGFLAPLLALIFSLFIDFKFKFILFIYFLIVAVITLSYIYRIHKEMKIYLEIIKKK